MKKYMYIGIGGILGSLARYFLSGLIINIYSGFPLNTFLINISGCVILGFFLTIALEYIEIDANVRLGISTGFVGSYTTFSTFTNEINMLLNSGSYIILSVYFLSSLIAGILSIWLGTAAARRLFIRRNNQDCEE